MDHNINKADRYFQLAYEPLTYGGGDDAEPAWMSETYSKKEKGMKITTINNVTMIRVDVRKPTGSGRRTGWVKLINSIDRTQRGGYALDGEFLSDGEQELPAGSVLVRCAPTGSVRNPCKEYDCRIVGGGLLGENEGEWSPDFNRCSPTFLDIVQSLLNQSEEVRALALAQTESEVDPVVARLSGFSSEQLLAELVRRGSIAPESGPGFERYTKVQ